MTAAHQAQAGDLAYLVGPRGDALTVHLTPGGRLETMHGVLQHADIIGHEWGSQVATHLGKTFILLQPALDDLLRGIERNTQVMYPKDIGYVLLNLGIGPGSRIIEAGSGSGALTVALAYAVGPQGQVYSYEKRAEFQELAKRNVERLGLTERVTFKVRDIVEGFDEREIPALFLDLPDPENYLKQARVALQPGGFFGCILPTVNQVSLLLAALKTNYFGLTEVSEILHRYYKPIAARLRPADTMTAHTGFLIFARCLAEGRLPVEEKTNVWTPSFPL